MAEKIVTANEELHSIRDTTRHLSHLIERMQRGDLEKVVITRHGKMVAVVRPVDVEEEG